MGLFLIAHLGIYVLVSWVVAEADLKCDNYHYSTVTTIDYNGNYILITYQSAVIPTQSAPSY